MYNNYTLFLLLLLTNDGKMNSTFWVFSPHPVGNSCCIVQRLLLNKTKELNVDNQRNCPLPESLTKNSYQTPQTINFRLFICEIKLFNFL